MSTNLTKTAIAPPEFLSHLCYGKMWTACLKSDPRRSAEAGLEIWRSGLKVRPRKVLRSDVKPLGVSGSFLGLGDLEVQTKNARSRRLEVQSLEARSLKIQRSIS